MIRIRRAIAADAMGIARVHIETWRATYPTLLPQEYLVRNLAVDARAAHWQRTIEAAGGAESVLVAVDAPTVVGFCSVGQSRSRPDTGFPGAASRIGEVFTLYVLPDCQNQGVGRGLLAAAFAALAGRGFDAAMLWVVAGNPSRFFYEAMGGTPIGEGSEIFAGVTVEQLCYFWPDLAQATARLASGAARIEPRRARK